VPDENAPTAPRRRVRRGEGEVTSWPRGLAAYVTSGPEDAVPSDEEDRTANRLALAGRLLGVLRSQGRDVDPEVDALRRARAAFARGDRDTAAREVDRLFAGLDDDAASLEATDTP
jgi:hypothetical protein